MKAQGPLMTIGELTLDDVVLEDQHVDWKQVGGGALYSAVGAALWTQAAICSAVGPDYPPHLLEELANAGIDLSAVARTTECNSLGLWLLYESAGARHQFEKAAGGTFQQLDALRPGANDLVDVPAAVHLAPQSSDGHAAALADFEDTQALSTLDLLIEPYIDHTRYTAPGFLRRVDAFLPSAAEVLQLWGHADITVLRTQLTRLGFEGTLVVKRGEEGVDVATGEGVTRVPAAASRVVDVTGAGDAFCGGFLAV
jgi:ribokinase